MLEIDENQEDEKRESDPILVVGIGASAGGLEALEEFFRNMPPDSGMAFVVVQHLSPDYKSLMDELLRKYTEMKVCLVDDGTVVEPNRVYLIRPRTDLTIFHNRLYLTDRKEDQHGIHLPIDSFFRSLAEDKQDHSIGIILSGTGSDGTLGIRAIKGSGGMVMVQDNVSAKFDGMPRSANDTGLVDFVLPPSKMPSELIRYVNHPMVQKPDVIEAVLQGNQDNLSKILSIVRSRTGVDFSHYKPTTIMRRLERRIGITQIEKIEEYIEFLANSPTEAEILYKDMLIGVTRFFRDTDAFTTLAQKALPELLKKEPQRELRVWCVGCSTGEEAYSVAILLNEARSRLEVEREIKVFATDVDKQSIEYAGAGIYPESIAADLTPELEKKYFSRVEDRYQVRPELRQMVIFANHDITKDPPFSAIDLISCRNMLIYLKPRMQRKILNAFRFSLNTGGILFLGSSESTGETSSTFSTIDSKWKLYRYERDIDPPTLPDFYNPPTPVVKKRQSNVRIPTSLFNESEREFGILEKAYESLIDEYAPASVVIDKMMNVVHVCKTAAKLLSLPAGKISLNIMNMIPTSIATTLSTALHRCMRDNTPVRYQDIPSIRSSVRDSEPDEADEVPSELLDIVVSPITDTRTEETCYLVSFEEHPNLALPARSTETYRIDSDDERSRIIHDLEHELRHTRENLQASIEELETSNEELQATNEELIASNEELQSTNEELHSVNEELYTVNSEYQRKIDELSQANNDLNNYFRNTNVGILFLDMGLRIRKYTPLITEMINVMELDVGRPISHLSHNMVYPEFIPDIETVLETLAPKEREVLSGKDQDLLIRITPYRTTNNAVEGIVITALDITDARMKESELLRERNLLLRVLENSPVGKTMVDGSGKITFANKMAEEILGISRKQVSERTYDDTRWRITDFDGNPIPPSDLPFSIVTRTGEAVYDYEHVIENGEGRKVYLSICAAPIFDDTGKVNGAVFSLEEVRERETP